jgi:hypothetical protein
MIDAMKKGLEVIDMLLEDYIPETTDEDADSVDLATEALRQAIAEAENNVSYLDIELAEMIVSDCGHSSEYRPLVDRVAQRIATHLRQAIEQAEKQEPVASIYISSSGEREFDDWNCALPIGRNELYAAPLKREWVGLTQDQTYKAWHSQGSDFMDQDEVMKFAKAIEAKLKELNHDN